MRQVRHKRLWQSGLIGTLAVLGILACRAHNPNSGSQTEAEAQNRYIIGPPAPWPVRTLDANALNTSMSLRRATAWNTVELAMKPIPVVNPETHQPFVDASGKALTLPTWQTWYDTVEFGRLFSLYYWTYLTDAQRANHLADATAADKAMAAFPLTPLSQWWQGHTPGTTVSRFKRLLTQITDASVDIHALNGVSGTGFSLYSPSLVRHYLMHYWEALNCTNPPDVATSTPADFATCFGEAFPNDAVAVKTSWITTGAGIRVFDTSAKGLAKTMTTDNQTWATTDNAPLATPDPSQIYTSSAFSSLSKSSETFQMVGMHLITKEIPDWTWTTIWWSPTPDTDFGEDRPASLAQIDGTASKSVWANYKMCTVSTFNEGDPSIQASATGLTDSGLQNSADPSLKAALAAAYHFGQPNTFCSDPFIELPASWAGSNCIGCHQAAGPTAASTHPLPHRQQVRQTFMSDFMWSFDNNGDGFIGKITEVLAHSL